MNKEIINDLMEIKAKLKDVIEYISVNRISKEAYLKLWSALESVYDAIDELQKPRGDNNDI